MNTSEFQQKMLHAGKPVVVDFWAPWCVPCRVTKPVLERLAKEYAENVEFLAVNADESSDLLDQFRVAGIPTVLALRDGKVMAHVTGAQNETGYRAIFEALTHEKEVKVSPSAFDRILRVTTGMLLAFAGISSSNWLVLSIGGFVAFLGVYDRCPIWAAISKKVF